MIGPSTFAGRGRMLTIRKVNKRRKVFFDYKLAPKEISLNTVLRKKAFKDFIRYNLLSKAEEELFFTITYPALYYPLFWYLEYFRDTHLLHASAVDCNGQGVVICGLEGIGKTSLALSLLEDKNCRFLSDNLVFYDREKVYPCHELVRIHKGESERLWKGRFKRISEFKAAKNFYAPLDRCRKGISVDVFIFPQFARKFKVKEIPLSEAVNKAIILSNIPSELSNYSEYANLYNWLSAGFDPFTSRQKALSQVLTKARCYEVEMSKSEGIAKNSSRLKEIIKNAS